MLSEIRNLSIVAKYTFFEVLKSKILMNVFFLGLGLLAFSYAATEFTFGTPQKVALDFGLGALSFSAVAISIFIGVNIINKEIESRTIYIILTQPISRHSFLVGRVLGMSLLLFLNILILAVLTLLIYFVFGGEFQALILWAVAFALVEAIIMLNIAVLFSLITNITMSVVYSLVIFFVGHSIDQVIEIASKMKYEFILAFCKGLSFFVPNLTKINIKDFLLYKESLEASYLMQAMGYGLLYIFVAMFASALIFNKKDLN